MCVPGACAFEARTLTRTPTCCNVKGDNVLAADTLQTGVRPWQLTEGAGSRALLRLLTPVRLPYHKFYLLLVLLRHLRPAGVDNTSTCMGEQMLR